MHYLAQALPYRDQRPPRRTSPALAINERANEESTEGLDHQVWEVYCLGVGRAHYFDQIVRAREVAYFNH